MPTPTTRTPTLTTRTPTRTRTRTTPASEAALSRAIAPVDRADFLADHWERRPLHVGRAETGRFDDLLSARDAERLVCEPGLRYPAFRLVRADARLRPRDYTVDLPWRPTPFSGTADVARVVAEFEAGATIVLQGLHLNWAPTALFCRELEDALGHPAQANAYYTPRRSQGLPVHHDTHDVFVLQVSGSKRWLVYEPVLELPLREQRYGRELGAPGEPVLEVELRAGDTLYLPRGWLHQALTSRTDSLHLTIGVNVYTWLDALRDALDRCRGDVDFRRSVGSSDVDGRGLLERVAARLESDEVAGAARARRLARRRPLLGDQLSQLRALDALTPETTLERRPAVTAVLSEREDGRVELAFDGKRLVFPAHAAEELGAIVVGRAPFRLSQLPGVIDSPGRLVLARRLVRDGFLRLAN